MNFPTFEPSSRSYSHGQWPISSHKFMTGRSQRMLHGTTKVKHTLKLTYENRPLEELEYFIEHFNAQRGTHAIFKLSEPAMFAGWKNKSGDKALLGFNQGWRYASAPRIRSRRGKLGSIEVELVTASYGDNAYTADKFSEDCQSCPPDSPPGSPPPPAPPKPPNGPDFPPDPGNGNGPPGGGDGGDGGGSGGSGGPDGPTPIPSPGPGDPTPEPEPLPNGEPPILPGDNVNDYWPSDAADPEYVCNEEHEWAVTIRSQQQERTGYECRYPDKDLFTTEATDNTSTYEFRACAVRVKTGRGWTETGCYRSGFTGCEKDEQQFLIWGVWGFSTGLWRNQGQFVLIGGVKCSLTLGYRERQWHWGTLVSITKNGIPQAIPTSQPRSITDSRSLANAEPRATATENNNFPNISPSRRRIVQGDYTINRFGEDQEVTLPLPSTAVKNDLVMDLVFANRKDEIARTFLDHYDRCAGALWDFKIAPVNSNKGTFAGWDDPDTRNIRQGRWIYARPPRVETTHPGYSTTTLQLINLLPETVDGPSPAPEPTPEPTPEPPKYARARLEPATLYYAPEQARLAEWQGSGCSTYPLEPAQNYTSLSQFPDGVSPAVTYSKPGVLPFRWVKSIEGIIGNKTRFIPGTITAENENDIPFAIGCQGFIPNPAWPEEAGLPNTYPRWELVDANGKVIADSRIGQEQGFDSEHGIGQFYSGIGTPTSRPTRMIAYVTSALTVTAIVEADDTTKVIELGGVENVPLGQNLYAQYYQ